MNAERLYVGIDVAKAHLDIAVRPVDKEWSVTNDDEGIGTLVSRLEELGPAMVVLEATGGLELAVTAALAAAELPVVVVNPRQVRQSNLPCAPCPTLKLRLWQTSWPGGGK